MFAFSSNILLLFVAASKKFMKLVLESVDKDGDGKIDKDEFLDMWVGGHKVAEEEHLGGASTPLAAEWAASVGLR